MPVFDPLPNHVSFPALEERVLAFWEQERIFERSLAARPGAEPFIFY